MLRQAYVIVALVLVIAVNALANILPFNGQTTGQISDRFPVYFVPAGYVFSIWGLIYVGLIAYAVYQAAPARRLDARLRSVDTPFLVSCAANAAWIFLWHYEQFALTVVAMVTLLLSLIVIYLRLGIGRVHASPAERCLVHAPFSVYLGWVTVATIANVTDVLYWAGWGGFGIDPRAWAVVMLVVGTAITASVVLSRTDRAFALVIVWAYVGVAVKQWGVPVVAYTAVALAIIVLALIAVSFVRESRLAPAGAYWRLPGQARGKDARRSE